MGDAGQAHEPIGGVMATLVARLSGPLQAWGVDPRFRGVATHATPTWSALLGLCRSALGHGRSDDPAEVDWLNRLPMAVRVDRPGHRRVDFHTVNPLPDSYLRFALVKSTDLGLVPLGKPLSSRGSAERTPETMITPREYLHDAAFTWFVGGGNADVARLSDALSHPVWTLSLGRKACTPASPVVHGIHSGSISEASTDVPLYRIPKRRLASLQPTEEPVELVWLNGFEPSNAPTKTTVLQDRPLGSHPQDGYTQHSHRTVTVLAPDLGLSWAELLDWSEANLTRNYLEES